MISDSVYWHCLRKIPGVGHGKIRMLSAAFPDGRAAWEADVAGYRAAGLPEALLETIIRDKRSIDPEEEAERLDRESIRVLLPTDDSYPPLLREIPSPPGILYVRGTIEDWTDRKHIAIVGSRKFTSYGEQAAARLGEDLARAGFTVVSGLAFGIDSIAHEAAIRGGGDTISILGGGIDDRSIAPASHLRLAHEVIRHGALLSDYPPGTAPAPGTFPARNRIIAGISLGTVVVEAAEKSGSLITANLALDFNRDVFAVPGSIFSPASVGTNTLIRSGAKIVRNVTDILEELGTAQAPGATEARTEPDDLSPDEERVYSILSHEPAHIDGIIKSSHCGPSEVSVALTVLELRGLAKNIGGNHYIRL